MDEKLYHAHLQANKWQQQLIILGMLFWRGCCFCSKRCSVPAVLYRQSMFAHALKHLKLAISGLLAMASYNAFFLRMLLVRCRGQFLLSLVGGWQVGQGKIGHIARKKYSPAVPFLDSSVLLFSYMLYLCHFYLPMHLSSPFLYFIFFCSGSLS